MTDRQKQITDMEAELRLPTTEARRRDLRGMLGIARDLSTAGR